jgi:hypothetical protein
LGFRISDIKIQRLGERSGVSPLVG